MNINKLENNNFHLIMSGSGARFISFVGSLSYYQNYYDNFLNRIKTITATSGGSIVGLLIALGYNLLTIKNYILNLESKDVKKSDYFKFLHSYGIDDGEKLINSVIPEQIKEPQSQKMNYDTAEYLENLLEFDYKG